jgi:crossover junction endodeoxyribonuclease RuvC
MLVLGIDPGSNSTGWGVVRLDRGRYTFVDAGCVRTRSEDPMAGRLVIIHTGVAEVLAKHRPDTVAIEEIFSHRSSESALRLGQARGVALLAAGQAGYEPVAYNPSVVKRSVGAHGRADKEGVAKMVKLLLGVDLDHLAADATDALAIAITHAAHSRTAGLVARGAR